MDPVLVIYEIHAYICFFTSYLNVNIIERLDQGHLYPLGERRDKHVTGGARTSAPLHRRRTLYLKSYLDSLYADYSEPLHGCPSACGVTHGLTWRRLVAHM
jgi:hypothetical protein